MAAMAVSCEWFAMPQAQLIAGLLLILLGTFITYVSGCLLTRTVLWFYQLPSTSSLQQLLSVRPRLACQLKCLHLMALVAGVVASISMMTFGFEPTVQGMSAFQGSIFLPKHPLQCEVRLPDPPALPSLMHPLKCPEWYDVAPLTRVFPLVALLGAICALRLYGDEVSVFHENKRAVLAFLVVWSLVAAVCLSGFVADRFMGIHFFLPTNHRSCAFHWLNTPVLFPVHGGAALSTTQLEARQEYFVSLILWLVILAFGVGELLTFLGRGYRFCVRASDTAYEPLDSSVTVSPAEHLCLHLLSGGLMAMFLATERLDVYRGVCWEAYVIWAMIILSGSMLHAAYFAVALPTESRVPHFGSPLVTAVLPMLGEPFDTFKDWIFVGIAVSRNNLLGCFFAVAAILILILSNIYLWRHCSNSLVATVSPVRAACRRTAKNFWAEPTSETKLAMVLTKDLPQALLQTTFVKCFGGSRTQSALIFLSVGRILLWAASVGFTMVQYEIYLVLLGEMHPWTLEAERDLGMTMRSLGRRRPAKDHLRAVQRRAREVLGEDHPDLPGYEQQLARVLMLLEVEDVHNRLRRSSSLAAALRRLTVHRAT